MRQHGGVCENRLRALESLHLGRRECLQRFRLADQQAVQQRQRVRKILTMMVLVICVILHLLDKIPFLFNPQMKHVEVPMIVK